ncbi:MAG TPA: NPCBM/NEW2 domain-containing protein [Marinagarivorans sp.]
MRTLIKNYAACCLLITFQCALALKIAYIDQWSPLSAATYAVLSCTSLASLYLLLGVLLVRAPTRIQVTANATFTVIYLALLSYHWIRHEPLSYLLIVKNGADLLDPHGFRYALSNVTILGWFITVAVLVTLMVLHIKFQIFVATSNATKSWWIRGAALFLITATLAVAFPNAKNEYYELGSSIYRYHHPSNASFTLPKDVYPYFQTVPKEKQRNLLKTADKPNVFIVMLESFSAYYMDRTENGLPVTPFLDELKHQGLFFDNFFSASVETSKGQFATLCSVYPSYRSNVFTSYADNNFRCLPQILKESGYTNVFLKAYHSLSFENTGNFVLANDFDHAHGMDENFVSKKERKQYKIGWGIQDNIFYQKTFEYLDTLHSKKPDSPFFVTTMSVTNHMMFDDIPKSQRYIYPNAKNHHENYTNSMHLTDKYLREFFKQLNAREYLRNSMVIVMGDNGFPMGQHRNNYLNTKTAFNEMFKTPLLIWWPNKITPKIIKDKAYSQLDIAPTITDFLNIKTDNHFVGSSVLQEQSDDYFVPLVQPFDGTYLGSIRYPYKFTKNLKTGTEQAYNLIDDPAETKNIRADLDSTLINKFIKDLGLLHLNELLLKEDRIYPRNGAYGVSLSFTKDRLAPEDALPFKVVGTLKEGISAQLDITHFNPVISEFVTQSFDKEITQAEGALPSKWFKPGINTLKLTVRNSENTTLDKLELQVFKASEDAQLLSDLDFKSKQSWGDVHINANVRGAPLRVAGQQFAFGIGTHASSEQVFSLDKNFAWLTLSMGMDDQKSCGDGAIFEITLDGKHLFSEKIPQNTVKKTTLNVGGGNTLKLITKIGRNGNCDHANWLNPVLYTADDALVSLAKAFALDITVHPNDLSANIAVTGTDKMSVPLNIVNLDTGQSIQRFTPPGVLPLPNKFLSPGYNRLHFNATYKDTLIHNSTQSVFAPSDKVTKLTNIKHTYKQDWSTLKINKSVAGNNFSIGNQTYHDGFGSHSNSEIMFELDDAYQSLAISFGLDDESTCGDGAYFTIRADDKLVYQSKLLENYQLDSTRISLRNKKTLSLVATQNHTNNCDHINWVNGALYRH